MRRSPPRPPPPPPPPLYPILGLMTKVYEGSGGASQARSSSHRPIRSPQRELHKDVFTKLRVKCAHSPVPLLRLPKTRVSCGRGMKKLLTPLPWPLLSKKKPPRLRPPKRVCTPRPHSFQGGAGGGGMVSESVSVSVSTTITTCTRTPRSSRLPLALESSACAVARPLLPRRRPLRLKQRLSPRRLSRRWHWKTRFPRLSVRSV